MGDEGVLNDVKAHVPTLRVRDGFVTGPMPDDRAAQRLGARHGLKPSGGPLRVQAVITFWRVLRVLRTAVPLVLCLSLATPAFATPAAVVDPAGTVRLGADESVPARTTIVGVSDTWVVYGAGSSYNAASLVDGHTVALTSHGDVPHVMGSMVAVAHADVIEWTDLNTGESGTGAISRNSFAGVTPTGWLVLAGATGAEFVDARSGAITSVGLPLGSTVNEEQATTGPLGAVIYSHNTPSAVYVTYAHPESPTVTGASPGCRLGAAEAVCGGWDGVSVVPLDGSPALSFPVNGTVFVAGVGTRVGWIDYARVFHTADRDGQHPRVSATRIDVQAATTEGFLYVGGASAADAAIYRLSDIGQEPTPVVTLGAGALRAQALAIGPGRVAWIDNASATAAVWSEGIHGAEATLNVSPRISLQATGPYGLRTQEPGFISVSGRRTVYGGAIELDLADGTRTTPVVLAPTRPVDAMQLSGTRLMFDRGFITSVIDVRTRALLFNGRGLVGPVLWGDYLAYSRMDGAVVRRSLVTGQQSVTKPLVTDGEVVPQSVRMRGDVIAWQQGPVPVYRNVRTSTLVHLPVSERLVGLAGAGILTVRTTGTFALLFRPYGSGSRRATTMATNDHGLLTAVIDGSVVAWIGEDGLPKVAPLPGGDGRPQFLGGGSAPRSTSSSHTWSAEWDTSAPLASCSVQLTLGRTRIRTLACDAAAMAVGVATVAWDGRNAAGRSVSASVAWRLIAGNAGGTVLAADGSAKVISGTFAAAAVSGR